MGQYFSSQKEVVQVAQQVQQVAQEVAQEVAPREEVTVTVNSTYPTVEKKKKKKELGKKERIDSTKPYIPASPSVEETMIKISQNPEIRLNDLLIAAKATVFENRDLSKKFGNLLRNMIIMSETGKQIQRNFRSIESVCRFLKVLVTSDNRYYLMSAEAPNPTNNNWVENLFEGVRNGLNGLDQDKQFIFSYILSMIKRHKELINKNEHHIFCAEIGFGKISDAGIPNRSAIHQDRDQFGDEQGGDIVYASTTNLSQDSKFKFSTEIMVVGGNESYTLASRLGEFMLFHNLMLRHRTPEINSMAPSRCTINPNRYSSRDDDRDGVPIYKKSGLARVDTTVLRDDPIIKKINEDLKSRDRRDILRIVVKIPDNRILANIGMIDITNLVPLDIFQSNMVTYEGIVSTRNPDDKDSQKIMKNLTGHSIGGKSKKKRIKKKGKRITKKRILRKNYSFKKYGYEKRGGGNNLSGLKFLNEYFAIYADPESACLIENNVEVIL